MSSVDNRIVRMEFDNDKFEQGIKQSRKSIASLKESLNFEGSVKGLESINKAAKSVNLTGIQNAVDKLSAQFSASSVMANQFFRNLTNDAYIYGKKIVNFLALDPLRDGFKEYEIQMGAIQTILANTQSKGTTLEDVNQALRELNEYADLTIYNFAEMTKNIGTFTAAGLGLKESVSGIKGVANLAAISGANSTKASMAMYQLSQALASGTVRLQDWMSIEHADMGGQVFQEALKETARVHKINIDKMIKQEGSFRLTLSKNWLTTEIMMETLDKFAGNLSREQWLARGYTEEQVKGIMKLGETATDAATKVKTFTQLIDTLKEALGSGWAQTWEILFGTFDEAKNFFTSISDYFNKIIEDSSEARNKILSDWKLLGGRDDLIKSFWNLVEGIRATLSPIKEAFEEIILDIKEFKKEVEPLTLDFFGLSGAPEEARKAYELTQRQLYAAQTNTTPYGMSGAPAEAMALYEANQNKMAVFIRNITTMIEKFTKALKPSEETLDKIKRVFRGTAAAGDILYKVLKSFVTAIFPQLGKDMKEAGGDLLDILAIIGDVIVAWNDWLDENKMFSKLEAIFKGLYKTAKTLLEPVIGLFQMAGDVIWEMMASFFGWDLSLSDTWYQDADRIKGAFDKINDILVAARINIQNFVGEVGGVLSRVGEHMAPHVETLGKIILRVLGLDDIDFTGADTGFQKVLRVVDKILDNVHDVYEMMKPYLSAVGQTLGGILLHLLGVDVNAFQNASTTLEKTDVVMAGIGRTFERIKNFVLKAKDFLAPVVPVMRDVFGLIGKGLLAVVNDVLNPYFTYLEEHRGENGSWLWTSLEFLVYIFGKSAEQISVAVGKIVSNFEDIFEKGSAARWAVNLTFSAKIIEDIYGIFKALNEANPIVAFSHIAKGVESLLGSIGKSIKRTAFFTGMSSMLLSIAAVLGVVGYLAYVSKDNADGMDAAIKAITTIAKFVGILLGVMVVVSQLGSSKRIGAQGTYFAGMGSIFAGIGVLMVGLAGMLKIISGLNMDTDTVQDMFMMLNGTLAVIFAGLAALQLSMRSYTSGGLQGLFTGGEKIARVGFGSIIGVILMLYAVIGAVKIMSTMTQSDIQDGFMAVLGIMAMMSVVLVSLNGLPHSPGNTRGIFSSVLMIIALTASLKTLGSMDTESIKQAGIALGVLLGLLDAMLIIVGVANDDGKMLFGLASVVGAIVALTGMLMGLSIAMGKLSPQEFNRSQTAMITMLAGLGVIVLLLNGTIIALMKLTEWMSDSSVDSYASLIIKSFAALAGLAIAIGGAVALASINDNSIGAIIALCSMMTVLMIVISKALSALMKDSRGFGANTEVLTDIMNHLTMFLGVLGLFALAVGGGIAIANIGNDPTAVIFEIIAMVGSIVVAVAVLTNQVIKMGESMNKLGPFAIEAMFHDLIGMIAAIGAAVLMIGVSVALTKNASAGDFAAVIGSMVALMITVVGSMIILQDKMASFYGGNTDTKTLTTFFIGINATVLALASSMVILAAATNMMSGISAGTIAGTLISMFVMMASITGALYLLSSAATENQAGYIQAVVSLGAILLVLSGTMKIIASVANDFGNVGWEAFAMSMSTMLLSMVAVVAGIRTVVGAMRGMDWKEITAIMVGVSAILLVLGKVSKDMASTNDVGFGALASAGMAYAIVKAVGLILDEAGRMKSPSDVAKIVATIGLIGVIMYSISSILNNMSMAADVEWSGIFKTIVTMVAVVGSLVALVAMSNKIKSVKSILALTAALMSLTVSVKVMSGIVKEMESIDSSSIVKFLEVIAIIAGATVALTGIITLINTFTGGGATAALLALSAAFLSAGASIAMAGAGFKMGAEAIKIFASSTDSDIKKVAANLNILLESFAKMAPKMAQNIGAILGTMLIGAFIVIAGMVQEAAPELIEQTVGVFASIAEALADNIPVVASASVDLLSAIAVGFAAAAPAVFDNVLKILKTIFDGLKMAFDEGMNTVLAGGAFVISDIKGKITGDYSDAYAVLDYHTSEQERIKNEYLASVKTNIRDMTEANEAYKEAMGDYYVDYHKMNTQSLDNSFGMGGAPQMAKDLATSNSFLGKMKDLKDKYLGDGFGDLGSMLGLGSIGDGIGNLEGLTKGFGDLGSAMGDLNLGTTDPTGLEGLDDQVYNPTVTPVVDDTNVKNFENGLNRRDMTYTIKAKSNENQAATIADINQNNRVAQNTGTVNNYTFNQTNNSPKALSRIELYRYGRSGFGQLGRLGVTQ